MDVDVFGNELVNGSYRHVVISVLRGHPPPEGFRALLARLRRAAQQHPERQTVINVLEATAFLPDAAEREQLSQTMKELDSNGTSRVMLVWETKGFKSVAFRAVVAGLSFATGKAQTAYSTVADAISAAAEDVPVAERAAFKEGLARAVAELRSYGLAKPTAGTPAGS